MVPNNVWGCKALKDFINMSGPFARRCAAAIPVVLDGLIQIHHAQGLVEGPFLGHLHWRQCVWWVDFKWVLVKIGYIVQIDGCFFHKLNEE